MSSSSAIPTHRHRSSPHPSFPPAAPTPPTKARVDGRAPAQANGPDPAWSRSRTPHLFPDGPPESANMSAVDGDLTGDADAAVQIFRDLYTRSEARIASLFRPGDHGTARDAPTDGAPIPAPAPLAGGRDPLAPAPAPKKPARNIDEDDYDDYDDDEDEADEGPGDASPLKAKAKAAAAAAAAMAAQASPSKSSSRPPPPIAKPAGPPEPAQTSEEVRKMLEQDKKAAEDAAKRTFHTLFYTLENDRDAMLEQQRLDELDRQVEAEMSTHAGGAAAQTAHGGAPGEQPGKLSSANLGASSLTLKHLIARIDTKRARVRASDAELRSLMSEVRKNRSKWASEDRVGQEELYEAAEKVLSELKAMTEHSTAFLTRVNKREAPDYYNVIKQPMDLGTMTKKLKSLAYKSKQDFVDDLNLIWANCLKYNADPSHFLRKHALSMRKETDKLVPLIPDVVIRDRAEVEAEERRMQNGGLDGDADGGEESDDEPIMSSRGRKAPGKKAKKGGSTGRKAPTHAADGPAAAGDAKPTSVDMLRVESDAPMEGSQNGLSTPPPGAAGSITPAGGVNGLMTNVPPGSQPDAMEIDGFGASVNGLGLGPGVAGADEVEVDDLEYKTWKQVTKRDRAIVAAERHRLFKGNQLSPDEPALLRTKAGMRRWQRNQRHAVAEGATGQSVEEAKENDDAAAGETLAEGMEGEDERVLPDYYDILGAIPDIPERLRWVEDADGQVVDASEEYLRIVPQGHFTAPSSTLTSKMEANMRQMQETRKICSKIGVIKQMQLQSQMYQNQFQKYQPEPFAEEDVPTVVVSDDGPIMSHWVCRAALQRSVGKIFYHAGFEEFQPAALDAITDIASDFFTKLARTLGVYREAPKVPVSTVSVTAPGTVAATAAAPAPALAPAPADGETVATGTTRWKEKFTYEESILHCLHENGLDVEGLESYVKDDVDRMGSKLGVMHERMRAHLADLLRPALADGGPDGSNAFKDGSEQFVGGDFAGELDEDFFGFKELGLDRELNLPSLGVPLHLLQNRMHNAYQAQNTSTAIISSSNLDALPPYEPVTLQSLKAEIGIVQNFFLAKLHANNDEALVEDDDLPQKQRFPKPRLPPTGKISSPRKRPLKEQGGNKAKKKKTDHGGGGGGGGGPGGGDLGIKSMATVGHAASKLKLAMPTSHLTGLGVSLPDKKGGHDTRDSDKEDGVGGHGVDGGRGGGMVGMMSPESIVAA